MQRTFIKYTVCIMTAAIFVILFINFLFHMNLLKESLDEDYLTRAKAAAYVLDRQKEVSMDVEQMQYIGVARKKEAGVVQVEFEPTRQMEAQSRNTYDYIFSQFPTDIGEEFFVADAFTGTVLGHADEALYEVKQGTKGRYEYQQPRIL